MKNRFRLLYRGERGTFFCFDKLTGKRTSLHTKDRDAAEQVVLAKNQALRQPVLNLQIAKAYLSGTDSGVATRTWQGALDALIETKHGSTKERWIRAAKDKALDDLCCQTIIETQAEHLLQALKAGTVSTNVHLRKLHNFCLAMNWLPWPIIPKRLWPEVRYKEKRAITREEHLAIIAREPNSERKAFYQLAWHLGASQSDLAFLEAENVDWQNHVISYRRMKTGTMAIMRLDEEMEEILKDLPGNGPLFPYLRTVRSGDRATEFKQRCEGLGIKGVTLHSYRYAWAERAKAAGYPERYAQVNLGHNSKAMTRAYSRKAEVEMPSLSEWERQHKVFAKGKAESVV
ncbi:MAG TPA: tyrosine-type recombinase/integrase [Verrucomicrobiota bacterium]|mgnify:FL=1|jgi:integrase|nr:tyrosine-type recombinase/integrase [Verrucomicrobiota bacterium]HRR65117.1 tyrosine-type recombinase/integrase [Candidatus Paceibacterota bacterium]HNR71097.1 tyrosine-type recombinase/integrase [Verrucomicrobiota bacterium]HOF71281.1 tyrosine-type recombinase/integrase [Verrucomicrobiota bacterium]HOM45820.1 tyrosine-type recombinase/integrase [Verrucomicrobiota bacterium]